MFIGESVGERSTELPAGNRRFAICNQAQISADVKPNWRWCAMNSSLDEKTRAGSAGMRSVGSRVTLQTFARKMAAPMHSPRLRWHQTMDSPWAYWLHSSGVNGPTHPGIDLRRHGHSRHGSFSFGLLTLFSSPTWPRDGRTSGWVRAGARPSWIAPAIARHGLDARPRSSRAGRRSRLCPPDTLPRRRACRVFGRGSFFFWGWVHLPAVNIDAALHQGLTP